VFPAALVGIDGGPGGRDALALARQLAATTILAHLHPLERGAPARALALLRAEAARAGLDPDAVTLDELNGWPGDGLRVLAARHATPLVVVGSSRNRGLGRLVHGDDVRATLHLAETAVAVAPAGWSEASRTLRRIGVGSTGDPASKEALAIARRLAGDAPVRVTEPDRDGETPGVPELEAFSSDLDLLVIGHVPQGLLFRLLVGSTADGLVRSLACPLLVTAPVRPGGTTDPDP
jgi:nucleotide-binding universal stress UspA family protein